MFFLGFVVAFVTMAIAGIALQLLVFRHMEGQDLRQTMVTIGISIILADLALWIWGGEFYQIYPPDWLFGAVTFPLVIGTLSNGDPVYFTYPIVRLFILGMALVIGVLLWLMLNRTRVGMMIRAGVDDREMLAASGINIQLVFVIVFAIGAGLAGVAGVVGSIFSSLAPGEDVRYLLASLVVVIVGGMGSITGAALGAILIGVAEQFGSVYFPTYAIAVSFLIMVAVLAFRPEGIMGARR
jgi:branched-chain amino acid transport system permease protein